MVITVTDNNIKYCKQCGPKQKNVKTGQIQEAANWSFYFLIFPENRICHFMQAVTSLETIYSAMHLM